MMDAFEQAGGARLDGINVSYPLAKLSALFGTNFACDRCIVGFCSGPLLRQFVFGTRDYLCVLDFGSLLARNHRLAAVATFPPHWACRS